MAKASTSNGKKAVSRSSSGVLLKEKAYQRIKQSILLDKFGPGTFLSERQIALWLKMSKTPIKAAFERLEHEGFITVSPQQGVVVRDLNIQEISDHFELRVAIEGYVVSSIAGRLTSEQRQSLRKSIEDQRIAVESQDVPTSVVLDSEFHALLCDFLGNEEIIRVMGELKDRIFRVVRRNFTRHTHRPEASYREHKRIADLIMKGEAGKAAASMVDHLEMGKQFLLMPNRPLAGARRSDTRTGKK